MNARSQPVRLVCTVLSLALLSACSTPSAQDAPVPAAAPDARPALGKGMTEEQVRAAWGEPKSVRPFGDTGVIWAYEMDLHTVQRMVAATMVEVPYFDPITEAYKPVMEPSFTPLTTTLIQTIELLLIEGRLFAWRRHLSEHRSFN